jgi:hypothetical protein
MNFSGKVLGPVVGIGVVVEMLSDVSTLFPVASAVAGCGVPSVTPEFDSGDFGPSPRSLQPPVTDKPMKRLNKSDLFRKLNVR